jgi:hypothetical protein
MAIWKISILVSYVHQQEQNLSKLQTSTCTNSTIFGYVTLNRIKWQAEFCGCEKRTNDFRNCEVMEHSDTVFSSMNLVGEGKGRKSESCCVATDPN